MSKDYRLRRAITATLGVITMIINIGLREKHWIIISTKVPE